MRKVWMGAVLLAAVVLFAGCGQKGSGGSPGDTGKETEFFCRRYEALADGTEDGIYIGTLGWINGLFYMDRGTHQIVWLCGKADCKHGTTECNAYFPDRMAILADTIQVVDDKLYLFVDSPDDRCSILYCMNLDGSSREEIARFGADGSAAHARYIDRMIYAVGTLHSEPAPRHIFRQEIGGDEKAEILSHDDEEDGEWETVHIMEMTLLGEDLYFQRDRYNEDSYDSAVIKYDTKREQFEELFSSEDPFSYFIADGGLYYCSFVYNQAENTAVYEPVMRRDLASGETSRTSLPGGDLYGYDGSSCYIDRSKAEKGGGIEVCTLDGAHVQTIPMPAAAGEGEILQGSCTYKGIVLHYWPEDDEIDEILYVYDLKKLETGTADGGWMELALHTYLDEDTHTMVIEAVQGG